MSEREDERMVPIGGAPDAAEVWLLLRGPTGPDLEAAADEMRRARDALASAALAALSLNAPAARLRRAAVGYAAEIDRARAAREVPRG